MVKIILLICGILMLVLPPDKIIKQKTLKDGETSESATKKARTAGILCIIAAILSILTEFI